MKRRFYRGKLPTIVWDPEAGKPLAEFVRGQFITKSDEVAEKLVSLGYREVALDAQRPPLLPEEPVQDVGDVRIMSGGMSEKAELDSLEQKAEAEEQERLAAEAKAEAEEKKKVKAKAKGKGGKGKGGRNIKRRPQ